MTKEAEEVLLYHSFTYNDINHLKSTRGFLGVLRPFTGKRNENNLHEVMEAIKTLADELEAEDQISKKLFFAI